MAEVLEYVGLKGIKKLNKDQCMQLLIALERKDLIMDIAEDGVGKDFHLAFANGLLVEADEFVRWQFTEFQGNALITFLEAKFQWFDILEHYGTSWKLKVSRDSYSIGYLFGLMEDVQKTYDISEYQVNQTTLEQIFNNFANETERIERSYTVRQKSVRLSKNVRKGKPALSPNVASGRPSLDSTSNPMLAISTDEKLK